MSFARPRAWLSATLDPPIQLAEHGSEAVEGTIEGAERPARDQDFPAD